MMALNPDQRDGTEGIAHVEVTTQKDQCSRECKTVKGLIMNSKSLQQNLTCGKGCQTCICYSKYEYMLLLPKTSPYGEIIKIEATVYRFNKQNKKTLNLAACNKILSPEQLNGHILVPSKSEKADKDKNSSEVYDFFKKLSSKKDSAVGPKTKFIPKYCKAGINKDCTKEDLQNGKTVYGIKKGEPDKRAEFVELSLYPTSPNDAVNRNALINGLHPHGLLMQANKCNINGTNRFEYKDVQVIGSYSVYEGKITTVLFSEDEKQPDSADDGKTEPKTKTSSDEKPPDSVDHGKIEVKDTTKSDNKTDGSGLSKKDLEEYGNRQPTDKQPTEEKAVIVPGRGGQTTMRKRHDKRDKEGKKKIENADFFPSLPKPGDQRHHREPSKQDLSKAQKTKKPPQDQDDDPVKFTFKPEARVTPEELERYNLTQENEELRKELEIKKMELERKEKEIQEKNRQLNVKEKNFDKLEKESLTNENKYLKELRTQDKALLAKDDEITVKDKALAAKDEALQVKDDEITVKDKALAAKDEALRAKDEEIRMKDQENEAMKRKEKAYKNILHELRRLIEEDENLMTKKPSPELKKIDLEEFKTKAERLLVLIMQLLKEIASIESELLESQDTTPLSLNHS